MGERGREVGEKGEGSRGGKGGGKWGMPTPLSTPSIVLLLTISKQCFYCSSSSICSLFSLVCCSVMSFLVFFFNLLFRVL